jgi:hypothetical protein
MSELLGHTEEKTMPSLDHSGNDEWNECRTTIGRLDTILADIRKYGFSLITGLLTGTSFLGLQSTEGSVVDRTAPFISIMVLIAALFSVDSYYQVLLSGAVERALDLEEATRSPGVRVTGYLSRNALRSGSIYVTLLLYVLLITTAAALAILILLSKGQMPSWTNTPSVLLSVVAGFLLQSSFGRIWLVLGLVGAASFVGVEALAEPKNALKFRRARGGALIIWLTAGPAIFALASAQSSASISWLVALAVLLVAYVECYWLWVAVQSGWHLNREGRTNT